MNDQTGAEYRFEMGITRVEFLRLLPFATGRRELHSERELIEGNTDGVEWSLRVAERQQRRIAALTLPILDVRLKCMAADDARISGFVERFLLAYQRAGG
ncbi:MAG TPA: hypothetical protein VEN29_12110 [Casimicrobiaceae bacterium]|nr:hypothetical protein [Casimicrobiaceae bacterium]